eukprot:m.75656 g.75656  ORF g.75656 m.75656 type:complete len:344 (-) comp10428_c0_seq2:232-1263(-)
MPIDPLEFEDDAPLPGRPATRHAIDRARERRISAKEVFRLAKRAHASGGGTARVTTGGGTTAVVSDSKVVTVYRAPRPSAYSAPHKRGAAMCKVPRCLLDGHGRERIRRTEAELGCHIQVPPIAPCDPVVVEVAVTGAPVESVEHALEVELGPWKVVDDAPPGTIVGPGGRTIQLLRKLVPGCEIHVAGRQAMRGGKQDDRTVLRGTPERMESAHTLIRKLHEYRGIVACPACGRTFNGLKKGRKHTAQAHATDEITDEALLDAGFKQLAQILSDPEAEQAEVERRRSERPSKVCSECGANKAQDDFSRYNWDLPTHSVRRRECLACTDRRHAEEGDSGDLGP